MGFLNSLFGCALTKYDAQKYFDYAEKQKAKGNIVEALNYYAKVINHGDLGVKPFVSRNTFIVFFQFGIVFLVSISQILTFFESHRHYFGRHRIIEPCMMHPSSGKVL